MNTTQQPHTLTKFLNWSAVIFLVYCMLVAVGSVSSGFKLFSGGSAGAAQIFEFATNPFVALILGTLATALVQSSSTVTAVTVGLVAGGLPISIAIPLIMGANMGTTITNTIVSIGHIREQADFKRAFSAATVHDFFNLMAVTIFLPLEMMFGLLEKLARTTAHFFIGGSDLSMKGLNFMKPLTKPGVNFIGDLVSFVPGKMAGVAMVIVGVMLILFSVTFLGKVLKKVLVGKAKSILHGAIGKGPVAGITSGAVVTVMVQSSSTTTSLMIPLAGSGMFTTRQIYPFTLGANIGTTITALLAATAISGEMAQAALTIALVHFFFNVLAVAVIYGIPVLRELPLKAADHLAEVGTKNKFLAFSYVFGTFFALPGLILIGAR
ncbi:Na/Pi symporter [Psychrobium sp. 1_MG-2023]|uniref:Na/Pi symporter n=1 Tax=Psychrobium sp. 1_MG-2023 TaxID=3062624 RepID=UPI000C340A64|nr:Na/Pi symporter [Psychrobium sp. 1_MG-2023]MDP2562656.1 Na/Pi symporter [Psychrobium sp. 1_MG-2023]PKF53815.1 sodium:phosphate symporter [Alteromonadales bacterium alter-6D02]